MAAPPFVFDVLGVVFSAILYGVYCMKFGLYWQIQLKRALADRRRKGLPTYALTINFILITMHFIVHIIYLQFIITPEPEDLGAAIWWTVITGDILYIAIDFISQLILLYRCWIMWHQPLVMVQPYTPF